MYTVTLYSDTATAPLWRIERNKETEWGTWLYFILCCLNYLRIWLLLSISNFYTTIISKIGV